MSGKGKRRGGPAGSDAAPVAKTCVRKGRGWTDPAASWASSEYEKLYDEVVGEISSQYVSC